MGITTTIPTNLDFPNRGVLERDDFVNAQETAQDLLAGAYTTALNQYAIELNSTQVDINTKAEQVYNQALVGSYSQAYIDATFTPKILNTQTAKTTPVDTDLIPLSDSASSFGLKKLSLANLKNTLFNSGISTPNINYKSTPITITSWSYATTTITLNVASHTFVAGDYIEVSGLTATTYPANGIHLVTSVTGTTIVFTLGATPTGTAGVSGATVKGYVTINGRVSESIGVNQTWQNLTASRISGTTYYNTSGKAIIINVYGYSSSANMQLNATINGTSLALGLTNSTSYGGFNFIVPNGASYSILPNSGTFTTAEWKELR